ncbi:MAG TPA: ABC transporter permease [Thermotogota bacterium]|nr:ABC transporter permease [Thermotogota bacterium]HRW92185.1 ABC transporter permease [Thermotogota bacterium]
MFWKYALKRILNGIFIYIILIFIFSALFNVTMERTARALVEEQIQSDLMALRGSQMTPEQTRRFIEERRERYIQRYHLDKPVAERVLRRAWDTLSFDYGKSTFIKNSAGERDVTKIVFDAVPKTLLLFGTAIIIDILLGLVLGIKKAQRPGKMLDKSTSVTTMVVFGLPSWWLGMLMIMFFAYTVKIFPSGGLISTPPPEAGFAAFWDKLYHLLLPVITLVVLGFWGRAFLTRNIVLGILQEDYVMSARARGIPERKVLYGHAMRTAAPPIVTMALLALLASVSGNIVFEGIFSWPGMGNLYWTAIQQNDVPVLMGNLSMTTGLYISGLVILDLIYGFLDPRIKVGGKG